MLNNDGDVAIRLITHNKLQGTILTWA